MGTRFHAVVVGAPGVPSPLLAVAAALCGSPELRRQPAEVVVHLSLAEAGRHQLLWCQTNEARSGQPGHDALAEILSRTFGPALGVFQSDSLGEAGFAVFAGGSEILRDESPIPGAEPLYPRIAEGFERAFPGCCIECGEDALDLFWGSTATTASFVVARQSSALSAPEPYVPPQSSPPTKPLLEGEFSWGIGPRRLLKGCVGLFGILSIACVLVVACWALLEVWRSR